MIRSVMALIVANAAIFILAIGSGDQWVTVEAIIDTFFDQRAADPADLMIIRSIRLPRAILALLVGATLAVAGAIVQSVMRNPLAEPGLLGINSGAALAALIVIIHFESTAPGLVSIAAFSGASAMALVIYLLSWRDGASSIRIILVGIGLSSLAGAGASFVSAFGDITAVQKAQVWLAGSVYGASWREVQSLASWTIPAFLLTMLASRELDLATFGESSARSLGQRVQWVRAGLILLCTIISAASVAAAGLIGFVGLMAPHAARRLVGQRHIRVLPVSALIGALLVVSSDLLSRTLISPTQLPVGLTVAVLGAPFFAFLLWDRRHVRI